MNSNPLDATLDHYLRLRQTTLRHLTIRTIRNRLQLFIRYLRAEHLEVRDFSHLRRVPHIEAYIKLTRNASFRSRPRPSNLSRPSTGSAGNGAPRSLPSPLISWSMSGDGICSPRSMPRRSNVGRSTSAPRAFTPIASVTPSPRKWRGPA